MRNVLKLLSIVVLTTSMPVLAQATTGQSLRVAQAAQQSAPIVEGEVKKIDKDAGKMTLKHGRIPNLDMPGMTMVFRVKDPAMLDAVKAGDKVSFTADKVNGALTVTQIAPSQ